MSSNRSTSSAPTNQDTQIFALIAQLTKTRIEETTNEQAFSPKPAPLPSSLATWTDEDLQRITGDKNATFHAHPNTPKDTDIPIHFLYPEFSLSQGTALLHSSLPTKPHELEELSRYMQGEIAFNLQDTEHGGKLGYVPPMSPVSHPCHPFWVGGFGDAGAINGALTEVYEAWRRGKWVKGDDEMRISEIVEMCDGMRLDSA